MTETVKISIILPVYNNEATLKSCIQSVQKQSYQNFELLIVDDGSEDRSYDICREYAGKDQRIHLQRQLHCGVVAARNAGLVSAKGTYLMFIDADDVYHQLMLEKMLNAMVREQVDLVVCSYEKLMGNYKLPCTIREKSKVYTVRQYLVNTLKEPGHHYYGVVWNKMFRMDVVHRHTLYFDKEAGLGEDFIFNLCYYEHINRVKVITEVLYGYNCAKDNSLSRNSNKTLQDVMEEYQNRVKIYFRYIKCFQKAGIYETYQKRISHYWVSFYIRQQYQLRNNYQKWEKKEKIVLNDFLKTDEIISRSLQRFSPGRIFMEQIGFGIQQRCKEGIKSLLNNINKYKKK